MGVEPYFFDSSFMSREEVLSHLGFAGFNFDLVVVRYAFNAAKVAAWKIAPCCIDIDDAIEDYVRISARYDVKSRIKRWIITPLRTVWYRHVAHKAIVCWVSNPNDVARTRKYCNCFHLPNIANGLSSNSCILKEGRTPYLLTVARLKYSLNYFGIDKFLREYWPAVFAQNPEMEFHVAGEVPDAESKHDNDRRAYEYVQSWKSIQGVKIMGFVDDLQSEYSQSLAVVAAVWDGGGTAIKTIEALKYGCKLFSSKCGVRGLDEQQIRDLSVDVFSNPDSLVHHISAWKNRSADERVKIREQIYNKAIKCWSVEAFVETFCRQIKANFMPR